MTHSNDQLKEYKKNSQMKNKINEKILKNNILVEKVANQKKITQIDLEMKSMQKI